MSSPQSTSSRVSNDSNDEMSSTDINLGPKQQKVTFKVHSDYGNSQIKVMNCSKTLDKDGLVEEIRKNIYNDPKHKGKATAKVTVNCEFPVQDLHTSKSFTLTINLNQIETLDEDDESGSTSIGSNEYKKLKTEANEAERLKLKHSTLTEKYNALLQQHNSLLELQKFKPQNCDSEHEQVKKKAEKNELIIEQVKSKIECPVCYEIPKRIPIPVCPNGHVVCQSCKRDDCPMCKEPMEDGRSLVAATVVENLLHDCDFVLYGCKVIQVSHGDLLKHLDVCPYRFHHFAWTRLSETAEIKLSGSYVDLGIKTSPVTSFYDNHGRMCDCVICTHREPSTVHEKRQVVWPPNAIEFDGTTFFLFVISDEFGSDGMWQFIVEWGDDSLSDAECEEARKKYAIEIKVFKPGDSSGCTRHYHQHSSIGMLDDNYRHVLAMDNGFMQGLFLDNKFAVTVVIDCMDDTYSRPGNPRFCCENILDLI